MSGFSTSVGLWDVNGEGAAEKYEMVGERREWRE